MSYLVSFCSCVFGPFGVAIASLGEGRANPSAFRTFVRFVLVWVCQFPLPLGVREGLRFVIVALPGLFSYFFFFLLRIFLFFLTDFKFLMFRHNIVKISEIWNKWNLLKTCIKTS